jgi:hypothetical protein
MSNYISFLRIHASPSSLCLMKSKYTALPYNFIVLYFFNCGILSSRCSSFRRISLSLSCFLVVDHFHVILCYHEQALLTRLQSFILSHLFCECFISTHKELNFFVIVKINIFFLWKIKRNIPRSIVFLQIIVIVTMCVCVCVK